MDSLIKEQKGLKRKLEFTVPAENVKSYFSKHYKKIQKTAKMPGFRQGKIPLETLKQTYKGHVHEAVMDDLFRSFYPQVLKANKIHPAGPPTLLALDLQEEKACKFLLEVEVHPEITIKNYKNLELKKKTISITEEKVSETLEKLRQSCATFEDSSYTGPLKTGDFATVNIEGFSTPKNQKKMNHSNLLLLIDKNIVAPGFTENLIGLNLNEEKEFDFTFPKDFTDSKVAGLNLHIKIKITGFKEKKIPELNNDLAKRFKLETFEDLKIGIKKDLKNNLEQQAKEELENNIIQQLVKHNPVELPEALIKDQKQKLKDNAMKKLEEYKMSKEERETFLKEKDSVFEKEARESLHSSYLVEQLIRDLKIETTQEDIKKSLQESFPTKKPEDMERELKEKNYWNNFIFNLTRKKVIDLLIKEANIIPYTDSA